MKIKLSKRQWEYIGDKAGWLSKISESDDQSVAKTILEQLGGNKFIAMTGAKNFMSGSNYLIFSLPGSKGFTKNAINRVMISLNSLDTYDIVFSRIRKNSSPVIIEEVNNVYNDQLQDIFTNITGLNTKL